MPVVRAFALYAGMALLIDFVMQVVFNPKTKMLIIRCRTMYLSHKVTCFVALMSLDMERQRNNRFDIVCCVKGKKGDSKPVEGVLYR